MPVANSPAESEATDDGVEPQTGLVRAHATGTEDLIVFATQLSNRSTLAAVMRAVQQDSQSKMLFAPKVTVFEGQDWHVSDVASRPFVVGLTSIATGAGDDGEPILETIDEGRDIKGVQTDPATGRTRLTVFSSRIEDVTPVEIDRETSLKTVLQRPHVQSESATVVTDLPDGGTVVIAFREVTATRFRRRTQWRYAFVTKRNLDMQLSSDD